MKRLADYTIKYSFFNNLEISSKKQQSFLPKSFKRRRKMEDKRTSSKMFQNRHISNGVLYVYWPMLHHSTMFSALILAFLFAQIPLILRLIMGYLKPCTRLFSSLKIWSVRYSHMTFYTLLLPNLQICKFSPMTKLSIQSESRGEDKAIDSPGCF